MMQLPPNQYVQNLQNHEFILEPSDKSSEEILRHCLLLNLISIVEDRVRLAPGYV